MKAEETARATDATASAHVETKATEKTSDAASGDANRADTNTDPVREDGDTKDSDKSEKATLAADVVAKSDVPSDGKDAMPVATDSNAAAGAPDKQEASGADASAALTAQTTTEAKTSDAAASANAPQTEQRAQEKDANASQQTGSTIPKVGEKRSREEDGAQSASAAAATSAADAKKPKTTETPAGMEIQMKDATKGPASSSPTTVQKPDGKAGAPVQPSYPQDADANWTPNQAMVDMVVNFLVRMAVHSGESKDRELSALYEHALSHLERALKVWPAAVVRLSFLDKLLATPDAGSNPALAPALDVFKCVLAQQPSVLAGHSQLVYKMAEHCFASDNLNNHKSVCKLLKIVFRSYRGKEAGSTQIPAGSQLHMRIGELIAKYLHGPAPQTIAGKNQPAAPPPQAPPNNSVICCLEVLKELLESGHTSFIDRF